MSVETQPLGSELTAAREGTVIGEKYRLEREVARGAWGAVWRARHEVLRKTVAIKLLRGDRPEASDDWAEKRMLREARAVSQIRHPSVVDVSDFGHFAGAPYIVMEFLEGHSLASEIRKGAMSWERACPLLLQAIEGLAAAHRQGIVHRDVKPSNLFLLSDGVTLKVVDFGIAGPGKKLTRITTAGEVLGTPAFMSPEQTRGMDITAQSDIYSLACVAHAMLTGKPPFSGTVPMMIKQHLTEPAPDLSAASMGAVPDNAVRVLRRCMEKKPADRFKSMAELYEAIAGRPMDSGTVRVASTGTLRRKAAKRANNRGMAVAAAIAGVLVLGGVGTYWFVAQRDAPHAIDRAPVMAVPVDRAPVREAAVAAPELETTMPETVPPAEPIVETAVAKPLPEPADDAAHEQAHTPAKHADKHKRVRKKSPPTAEPSAPSQDTPTQPVADTPKPPVADPPITKMGGVKNPFAGG